MTTETKAPNKKNKSKRRKIFWSILGILIVLFISAFYFFYQYVIDGLPGLEQLENPKPLLASNVFSSDGELIGQFFRENRLESDIDSIPGYVIQALIATEDRKFYDHWGVDLERFLKAMAKNIFLLRREGASTITQQMAKNLYNLKIVDETIFDTLVRKFREWITAIQIEKTYTKNEILEMYFNVSYFGRGAYGIETAAKVYFNKKINELTIPEAAVLIAILKSSVVYDPIKRYDNALQRRNVVLYSMVQAGYLPKEEYEEYKNEPIKVSIERATKGFKSDIAPHYVEYIRQQLDKMSDKYGFDLYSDGLTIYTSLDTKMQNIANRVIPEHLDEFQKKFDDFWNWREHRDTLNQLLDKAIKDDQEYRNLQTKKSKDSLYNKLKNNIAFVDSVQSVATKIEVGFVVIDVRNGEIKALVGGRDLNFRYGLNHATQIRRQPGSAFKAIIYTVALDNGLYPAYPILNQPFDYNEWIPNNFDMSTGGFTTLRHALKKSINIVTARLIIEDHVQLWKVGRYAQKMGIKTRLDLVPAISLGAAEVTPLEMTSVYATIANKGIYNEPISVLKIEDKDGIIIENFFPTTSEAISEETAYIITNMLQSVIEDGTGIRVRNYFHRPAGGKTGTSQEYGDAWFIGFTPQLTAGVWVGFDDRRISFTGNYGAGSKAALPIWAMFMKEAYEQLDLPLEYFEMPESQNVVEVSFCEDTIFELGDPKLYSPDCESGSYSDIINLRDVPRTYNAERDTSVKIFNRYMAVDSMSHEALEIEEGEE